MDSDAVTRLRDRAVTASRQNPTTLVTACFLVSVLDALLDEVQDRPLPPGVPLGGTLRIDRLTDLFG